MIQLKLIDHNGYDEFIKSFQGKIGIYHKRQYVKNKRRGKIIDKFDKATKRFFKWFVDDGGLIELAYAKPDKLRELIFSIETDYPDVSRKKSNLYENVYHAFVKIGYENDLNKEMFLKMLGLTCCPYCNRAYVQTVRVKGGKKAVKAEIDHFFSKEKYPYLALSLYNLIPSCSLCNGYAGKHDSDAVAEALINPYEIEDEDLRFTFNVNNINDYYSNYHRAIEVKLNPSPRFEANMRMFNLQELYEHHADHVAELVHKSKIRYPNTYREFMTAACPVSITREELNRLIVGNYADEADLHRRPLAKMYGDIARELNLID